MYFITKTSISELTYTYNSMGIEKIKCRRCGYTGYPRKESKPKVCSRCKSLNWDIKGDKYPHQKDILF